MTFGDLGAPLAFPGALATSWGAQLVEPPSIAALRGRCASELVTLGELAPAKSGIATRVVGYFMVEEITDRAEQALAGIRSRSDRDRLALVRDGRGQTHVLERAALRPVVRRPGALEGRIDVDEAAVAPWKVLYLADTKESLERDRWAHTVAYIRYGETTDFPAREGSRRRGGVPAERPQVRVRPVWFQVPRIPDGPGRVCWIKGRGDRHYAPSLAAGILVPDNFLFSAPPPDLANPRAFAAIANLTWTHLMVEVYGRRGGGDGVLHTYIRELNMLPIIDPRRLTATEAEDLCALFEPIASRPVQAIDEELRQRDRQAFDLWAMRHLFGEDNADDAARTVERAIRDLARERTARATSGRDQERRAVRRTQFDPVPLAARALGDAGEPPSPLTSLPPLDPGALGVVAVAVEQHPQAGHLTIGQSLFDSDTVLIDDKPIAETPSHAHASAVRAVLRRHADFSGTIALPADERDVDVLAVHIDDEWLTWRRALLDTVAQMLPGPQRASRRESVLRQVESVTGAWPDGLTSALG